MKVLCLSGLWIQNSMQSPSGQFLAPWQPGHSNYTRATTAWRFIIPCRTFSARQSLTGHHIPGHDCNQKQVNPKCSYIILISSGLYHFTPEDLSRKVQHIHPNWLMYSDTWNKTLMPG